MREGVSAGLAAQRVDEQTPMFGAVGRLLDANPGLLALIALVIAELAFGQDREANEQADPPPSVTVQVEPLDRAEVARIVEEHLREQEQQQSWSPTDRDFRDVHLLSGSPRRLLVGATGNITNAALLALFEANLDASSVRSIRALHASPRR